MLSTGGDKQEFRNPRLLGHLPGVVDITRETGRAPRTQCVDTLGEAGTQAQSELLTLKFSSGQARAGPLGDRAGTGRALGGAGRGSTPGTTKS